MIERDLPLKRLSPRVVSVAGQKRHGNEPEFKMSFFSVLFYFILFITELS